MVDGQRSILCQRHCRLRRIFYQEPYTSYRCSPLDDAVELGRQARVIGIRRSLVTGWYIRCPYAAVLSFPSRFVIPPRGLLSNPPENVVVPEGCTRRGVFPEPFCSRRGVLF